MIHRIEVNFKSNLPDPRGNILVRDIHDIGIKTITGVRVVDVYWLDAEIDDYALRLICNSLLADPLTQEYRIDTVSQVENGGNDHIVEVAYNAGVTDPVEDTVKKAVRDLGIEGVDRVKTAKRYIIEGQLDEEQLLTICNGLLVNPIIQHLIREETYGFPDNPQYQFYLKHINILGMNEEELLKVRRDFGFSTKELQVIKEYYQKQGKDPTDIEIETLAQTWSEHCVHKTFKGRVKFGSTEIDNLLKSTIMKATKELNKPWCLSVFEDNAGVIDFDGDNALCFKVETHNHPSAVEPYGGAATGIGGVIRDPLGTGLGAKPILNTDVFCFAPPNFPDEKIPKGTLHPRRVFKGVRAGVADYANRLGIPTLNGAVLFHDKYIANPLVFCGTLGLLPKELALRGKQQPGDKVVLIGGKTGRDGIHGVTFASEQLTGESGEVSFSSVQIGNPIVEKKFIDVLLQARDRSLYRRITDCGGGGLSSAVGEMAAETGVSVNLEKVPLKYAGLSYPEIWISESQERMILAVPPEKLEELLTLFNSEDVEATVIGEFTADRRLKLFYDGNQVGDLSMQFLHEGLPKTELEAIWEPPQLIAPDFEQPADLGDDLLKILGSWNVCSKEWVIRQYDHEVQGTSILKPLVGKYNDGPGDAAIIRPVLNSEMGAIISNGINPSYGEIDPYWMAASAIDEALRQIITVGGSLDRVALLDNFCWGNTDRPEMMGALVRAAKACYDMAIIYGTPFISGKDSLNNEFTHDGKSIAIPHTLLISAIGVMKDGRKAISMDFKESGNLIYAVGETYAELGGSEYFRNYGFIGNSVPKVDPKRAVKLMSCLSECTGIGLVRACHDCSEGGIGVAIAEMAFAGGLGASINLSQVPLGEPVDRDDYMLFSESNSRFIVEVEKEKKKEFEEITRNIKRALIGKVTDSDRLEISGVNSNIVVDKSLDELKEAWQSPLRW